jgi:hypothetical protein
VKETRVNRENRQAYKVKETRVNRENRQAYKVKETRVNRENRQAYKAVLSKPEPHKTFAVIKYHR